MLLLLEKILPVLLIFFLGYFLKKIKFLKKETGDLFLKLVFYVTLPALYLNSLPNVELSFEFIYLPIFAPILVIITYFVSLTFGKRINLQRKTLGTFLLATMIMNTGFSLPFIIAGYGDEGLVRASLFDLGNAVAVFIIVYYVAVLYGRGEKTTKFPIEKILYSIPIWAVFIALTMNFADLSFPSVFNETFSLLGGMTIPFIMLSLGIYLNPKIVNAFLLFQTILIRVGLGIVLGLLYTTIFQIEGLTRIIILLSSTAPVGYNTLTFSSLENLDKEFAASVVSFSILAGIIYMPILILLFGV